MFLVQLWPGAHGESDEQDGNGDTLQWPMQTSPIGQPLSALQCSAVDTEQCPTSRTALEPVGVKVELQVGSGGRVCTQTGPASAPTGGWIVPGRPPNSGLAQLPATFPLLQAFGKNTVGGPASS